MGKKSGPAAPAAPDPVKVSQAQSESNIATAREQQRLNMVNSYGPQGSVVYQADPNAPGGYSQTTSLSPSEQAIYDAQKRTELGATNIAYDQLGRVQGALQTPLNIDGLSGLTGSVQGGAMPTSGGIQRSFETGPALQYGFNQGQAVQGSVGGDLEAARKAATDAVYSQATSRLDPRFAKEEAALGQRLADQGFSQNSQGYTDAMAEFRRGKNDAYNQAQYSSIGAGEDAANSLFQRQLGQGQFANEAAAQQFGQGLNAAQFYNQTAGQQYGQNKGAAEFNNAAQGQAFNQDLAAQNQALNQGLANAGLSNAARQQGLQERAYLQNQPINQLTGLLGLGQVGMPQGIQYTPSQVAPTDVTGAYALQSQAQQNAYNAQAQRSSGLMGGLFSLGSAAIMASDGRLKTDKRLLRVRPDGIEVWAYRYITDDEGVVRIGVMAQQVKKKRPDLVVKRADGFLAVNYAGLDLEAA